MQQKKVIVVATGGTIAMKYDEASQGLIPACSGEDLAAAVPGIDKLAQLEFCQFSNIASPGMTPDDMWRLHLKCEEFLAREDVTGVVVTHGIILRTAAGSQRERHAGSHYKSEKLFHGFDLLRLFSVAQQGGSLPLCFQYTAFALLIQ